MKILHCIPTMEGGGAERQLVYLAEAQVGNGHDVHVALRREGSNVHRLRASGAAVHLLRHGGSRDPRVAMRLASLIGEIRPDVVQTWLSQMDVIGGMAVTLKPARWVATEHSSASAYPPSLLRALRTMIVRRAAIMVANCEAGAQYWRELAPRLRVTVVPNAVPFEELQRAVPADLGRFEGRPLILHVARLDENKNVVTIIESLAREPLRGAVLIVCGEGPLRPALEAKARDLGVDARVTFAGFVDDLPPLLMAADVFVSASFYEGRPNNVLEAVACRRPVVVSDIPAHREFLTDASARFFDPHDADGAAAALAGAIRDCAGTAARVAAAQESVRMLDPLSIAELYDRVYERVMSETES